MIIHWVGIGDIKLARRGEQIAAVLGSCVGIILWHPQSRLAIMNHVLLPNRQLELPNDNPGRYADESWRCLCARLCAEGVLPHDCVCHIIGGGYGSQRYAAGHIGQVNVTTTCELIAAAGIRIESRDTGGSYYRVVKFDVDSGELTVHRHTPISDLPNRGRENVSTTLYGDKS